ncbi:4-alpha-glucanotransferase [Mariniphaga anaerophila]|uniref:4-alpha-glucanotransferase n=1 Tax=Mariniphaga anaerophila TaxID=1484053 RepID=A0A1M5AGR2_9BACT|nr:4-alpha-glucanotransferase [Mariniphaga anaerophila]SHF29102.1 4-alpha-glucanotransferase [Mariniphaga anaerophila]
MVKRNSGVLAHVTSLPGQEGIGTLGKDAFRFIDFLAETGQTFWQILPLGPVGYGNSPYQCYSAFAGNPLLIDLNLLVEEDILSRNDLEKRPRFLTTRVDFLKVEKWKYPLLRKAFENFQKGKNIELQNSYHHFLEEHGWWLHDYALFMAAKVHFKNAHWSNWEHGLKFRESKALQDYSELLSSEIEFRKFVQFLFFKQWFRLKSYAREKEIQILGDMPLYVSGDSVDIWANTDIFVLDEQLKPTCVGGVPPDYFSGTGQLWGNPVFNWERLQERDFDWWLARLHFNVHLFDKVRIDHFRGLESFWSVPAAEKTAINGQWVPANGFQVLEKFKEQVGSLPLIAEDLGLITPEVENLRNAFNLPGMKVLQFAFSSDPTNEHLPHNYLQNFVAYTGTHDNDTTLGWLQALKGDEHKMVKRYLGSDPDAALEKGIEWIWSSAARSAVLPMQDLLQLGTESRLNTPGVATGNWEWRFNWRQLKSTQKKFLLELTEKYNRKN